MSSCKERQRKHRAKVRQNKDLYLAQLEKDRKRKALQREKARAQMSESQLQEHRAQERARVRKYKEKKRAESLSDPPTSSNDSTPYRCTQTLGKALKRVRQSLPASPHKQRCVIERLAEKAGISVNKSSPSQRSTSLSVKTVTAVNAFYLSNDISWQAPGRKDRVIVREKASDGKIQKRTEQTRYMLMSLREAHQKFKEEHPGDEIGLSKFCELRPVNVKCFDHLPHQVCLCPYHENIRLLLVALRDHTSLTASFAEFVGQVTCDGETKQCLVGECDSCKDSIDSFVPSDTSAPIRYHQWQNVERSEKVEMVGTVGDAFGELKRQLRPFLIHTYVKRSQSAHFESLTSSCDGKNVVLQVDFSENATIASQCEIQSAHWSHAQSTLFTAHAWIDKDTQESMVV